MTRIGPFCSVACAALALIAPARGQSAPAERLTIETRTLRNSAGAEITADFGRLAVPENRARPGSRHIRLAFVRLRSTAAQPGAPLVYLAGGPGDGATRFADSPGALTSFGPLLELGDVVFWDQRGTGKSEPDMSWTWPGPIPETLLVDQQSASDHVAEMSRRAARHCREQGIDLTGYTTVESAHDLADLRAALNVPKLSLLGFSYGTHLGQATMRLHPEILENVVLVGVEPLDATFKPPLSMDVQFRKLALLAARDPRIAERVPDLTALLERVLARLEREPMVVEVTDPRDQSVVSLPVGKFGLQVILRFDIGDASDLPVFPRLLYAIDQGEPRILAWFVQKRLPILTSVSAMSFVMDAASGASPERLAVIRAQQTRSLFGSVANFPFLDPDVIAAWQPPDLGDDYRAPLVSDVRTLLLTGTLDWNTPPYQAEQVRFGLANAFHIVVPNAGHEQILPNPDIKAAVLRFLKGEDVSDARASQPPLRFVPLEGHDPEATHPSVPPG